MRSSSFHLIFRGFLFLFSSIVFLTHTAQSDDFPIKGTWIAKSTFIDHADVESKKHDTGRQVYIPAGTRFVAYNKTDRTSGPNMRLILTETGLWGYIVDSPDKYWIPEQLDFFKNDKQKAIIPRDFVVKYEVIDRPSSVKASYEITMTRSEIYNIVNKSECQITIELPKDKLDQLRRKYGEAFPKELDIPCDKAIILDPKDINLSAQEIPYLIKLSKFYSKTCASRRIVAKATGTPQKTKLLFVGASPGTIGKTNITQVKFAEELQVIKNAIDGRGTIQIEFELAARPKDLLRALEKHNPRIVHFSGHGDKEEITLVNDNGQARPLTGEVLKKLLYDFNSRGNIQVVVLNACKTQPLAAAIAEVIGCAIGMRDEINPVLSKTYSNQFYSIIAAGGSVQEAHDKAVDALGSYEIPGWDKIVGINPNKDVKCQYLHPVIIEPNINAETEMNLINSLGDNFNVTRWYYWRNNACDEIYKLTKKQDCNPEKDDYYSYVNNNNFEYSYEKPYGNVLITDAEDYFTVKDKLAKTDFGEYEKAFIISQCFKAIPKSH